MMPSICVLLPLFPVFTYVLFRLVSTLGRNAAQCQVVWKQRKESESGHGSGCSRFGSAVKFMEEPENITNRLVMIQKLKIEIHPVTAERWSDFELLFGKNGAYD